MSTEPKLHSDDHPLAAFSALTSSTPGTRARHTPATQATWTSTRSPRTSRVTSSIGAEEHS